MVSESHRKRAIGWIAGLTLAAMAVGVTGCSNGTGSTAKNKSTSRSSNVADSKKEGKNEGEKEKKKKAGAVGQSSATDHSTAEGAVAAWVTAVVKGQAVEACLLMGEPATGSSPAKAGSSATCDSDAPEAQEMKDSVGKFRESFMPEPPTDDPKVEVATVPVTNGTAVFPADKVTVDGQPLEKIILSHSSGVEEGQLDVKLESSKIENAWYVTNLQFHID